MAERPKAKRKNASRKGPAYFDGESSGFGLRLPAVVREHPADAAALLFAAAGALAIVVNAILLQPQSQPAIPAPRPVTAPSVPRPAAASVVTSQDRAQDAAGALMVREAQEALVRRGFYEGPSDGVLGPKTEASIRSFETSVGMPATGQPSPRLLGALRKSLPAPAAPAPVSTQKVMNVQGVLQKLGYGPIEADGVFGEGTRAAIRRFEATRGLPQRGEITPALLRELSKVSGLPLG
jgi:peptidoglycan hydrolase-like protein with peptidoglycan-binding domain